MSKHISVQSGHTLFVKKIDAGFEGHPAEPGKYTDFYVVKNFSDDGVTFFYLAKGYHNGDLKAPREVHVWYKNKRMWTGFGSSMKDAIEGAQRDGWMHAE